MTSLEEYNPKVSIVTATHNRADLIGKAIESVLYQTYTNWELCIVADGCTDNTGEVVSGFGDARIEYHPVEKMEYYTHVRNYGIEHTDGELLAFRDDDGAWHKDFLKEAVLRHRNQNIVLTYCGRKQFEGVAFSDVDLETLENTPGRYLEIPRFIGSNSLTNLIDVGDMVLKRSVFGGELTGFSKEKDRPGYCSDALLVDDIHRAVPNGQIVAIDRYLHYYFLGHGGKTENMTIRKLRHRQNEGVLGPEEEEWTF